MRYDLTDHTSSVPDEGQRRATLVVRALPALLIPFIVAIGMGFILNAALGEPPPPPPGMPPPPGLRPELVSAISLGGAVALTGILVVLIRLGRITVATLMFVAAWTLITLWGVLQNGVMSFWAASLILPVCAAALLLNGAASLGLAALATLLVCGVAWLETQGIIAPRGPMPPPINFTMQLPPGLEPPPPLPNMLPFPPWGRPLGPQLLAVGYWAGLYWSVAILTSLLASGLQQALQQSRAQAHALSQLSAGLEERVAAQTAELAQRAARAEALYEVGRALTSTLDLPTVLGLIAEQAARLLKFDASLVLLVEGEQQQFEVVGAYHEPAGLAEALRTRESVLHRVHEQRQSALVEIPLPGTQPCVAALVLPMVYGTSIAGVLVLVELARAAERNPDDLALAEGFASQAAVAIANARLLMQARDAATVEERARLARDIHDTLAQGLASVVIQLGAAQRALVAAPDEAAPHVELAGRMARESLAEARRSVWNLRAAALERGDLGDALRGLAGHPMHAGTETSFAQVGVPWPLPPDVESALLRVCQEALANVAKHARAEQVGVTLEYQPDGVRLIVQDDGVGFDAGALRARSGNAATGFGLLGMRERLAALGGTLALTNAGGARVVATVPRPAGSPNLAPGPALPAVSGVGE